MSEETNVTSTNTATAQERSARKVREGLVVNPDVLAFQHRSEQYPHPAA